MSLRFPDEEGCNEDFRDCFLDDYYGLRRVATAPRTILDVGANVGFFSMAVRGMYPEAVVHAYEPNPRVLACLAYHAQVAGFSYFPEAVGATPGRVEMIDESDSNAAMTRDSPQGPIEKQSLTTAIERLGGQVDLAKINCEGAEWELLRAADCWGHIGHLHLEYHRWGPGCAGDDPCRRIAELGFRIIHVEAWEDMGLICARRVL